MNAQKWNGIGDYDFLLTLNEHEMRDLCFFYDVDWSFFTEGPSKSWEDKYYCFINLERKVFALLPFLSLAFGGMYSNLPMEQTTRQFIVDYCIRPDSSRVCVDNNRNVLIKASEFTMEDFKFPAHG